LFTSERSDSKFGGDRDQPVAVDSAGVTSAAQEPLDCASIEVSSCRDLGGIELCEHGNDEGAPGVKCRVAEAGEDLAEVVHDSGGHVFEPV
jgi:hypothetical protein